MLIAPLCDLCSREVPVKVKASSGELSQHPVVHKNSFALCRMWLGIVKPWTQGQETGKFAVRQRSEFIFTGEGKLQLPQTPITFLYLKVPHLTPGFISILKIPTKSLSLLHSQLLGTAVGIFYTDI